MVREHDAAIAASTEAASLSGTEHLAARRVAAVASGDKREGSCTDAPSSSSSGVFVEEACCCHHKATPRSEEFKASLQKRLNRAIGQLNGVKGMLDDNRYCGDVLMQLAAAETAIHNVSLMLLQDHMETCVIEQIREGNDEVVDEVMQLVKRFAK